MTQFTSSQLRLLKNASEGVKRVTEQLEKTIYEIAYLVSDLGSKNDSITIDKKQLQIIEDTDTGYNYLTLTTEQKTEADLYGIIFDYARDYKKIIDFNIENEPLSYRFHGYKPTRDYYKFFAENLGDILQGFITLWKSQEETTKNVNAVIIRRELKKITG